MITNDQLSMHEKWLMGDEGGQRLIATGANLRGANLSGVNLRGADLSGANLTKSDLSGANLTKSDLSGADLSGADLSGSNLYKANLCGADLNCADLSGANLNWAILCGADLSGANLSGANLSGANLNWANLNWADLSGAVGAKVILKDPRFKKKGYQLVMWNYRGAPWFISGCRSMSLEDALDHWGRADYDDVNRGQMYLTAIERETQ